jgi:hypothetical protein
MNPHTLFVGMQISTDTMEMGMLGSLRKKKKTKTRITI